MTKLKYLSYALLFVAVGLMSITGSPDAAQALPFTSDQIAMSSIGLAGLGGAGMIMDELGEFCDATSVAAAASTALVGDVIDLGGTGEDVGGGRPVYLVLTCATDIITAGVAGTISFALASDAQAAIAVDGSATTHFDTGTFVTDDGALNELDAGDVIAKVALPMNSVNPYERYLGVLVTVGTAEVTAGAINAFLTYDPSNIKAYPDASN